MQSLPVQLKVVLDVPIGDIDMALQNHAVL